MDTARWQRLQAAFAAVTECSPEQRTALVERICTGDDALRTELESLLEHWESDPDFLEQGLEACAPFAGGNVDDDLVGGIVGAWKVLRRIGRGGMGAVYLAERVAGDFEQYAAIKVLARGMDSEAVLARFHAERRILAALEHPHIARIIDGGMTGDGRPWFAMPYLEGAQPLDTYCDAARLPVAARLRLMISVCTTVQFAHQNLVVHRDLKPANILVTSQGEPMLLDFGIAKLLDHRGAEATDVAVRVLTPEYASPEQRAGEAITTASDVYQLGALLYKLLCGERPAADRNEDDGGRARPSARVTAEAAAACGESADALRRRLRGDLDTICLHALQPEPQRRYRSAEALAEDLERYLRGLPVQARTDTFAYRAGKFLRRNRWGAALAATVFAAAVGFGVFASVTASRIAAQAEEARAERDRAQAIAGFMTDLFKQTNPTRSQQDLTASELLERGLELLAQDDALRNPERAAVLTAVGAVYSVRGEYEPARAAVREAVDIGRRDGSGGIAFANSLLELSKIKLRLGEFAAAEAPAREAIAVLEALPDEWEALAIAHNQLAVLLRRLDRPDEAVEIFERVISLRSARPGADTDQNLAINLANLGLTYISLDRLDQAETVLDRALAILERRYGPGHVHIASTLSIRSSLHEKRGDLQAARRDLKEALEIAETRFGPENDFVAYALYHLGRLDTAEGNDMAARARLERALLLQQKLLPPEHPDIALSRAALAALNDGVAEGPGQ